MAHARTSILLIWGGPGRETLFNAKLRREAEESSVPTCSRFLYYIMAMVVLEQEGLMDSNPLRKMEQELLQTVYVFETEDNRKIALLAI